jgi:TonB family protein
MRILVTLAALLLAARPAMAQSATPPHDSDTYELKDVEEPPQLLNARATALAMSRLYPPSYRALHVTGDVMVSFRILENGTVDPESVTADRGDDPLFADAAIRVARQMRFRPAKVNHKPVRAWAMLPVRFSFY